jgi:large subunit ribosomal protein L3
MQAAILGKKVGMTSYYTNDGRQIPCTVIQAGPCPVITKKSDDTDGYRSVQIAYGAKPERTTNMPDMGQFRKAGVSPHYHLREFRDFDTDVETGSELTIEQFEVGDKLKISGKSKGRGFQGVMKRHNFGGVGMTTHGQSDRQRHPGSIGQSSDSSRVFKGIRMAGRMGGKRTTVRNLMIVDIIEDKNLILVQGSVPGAANTVLEIVKL